MGFEIERKQTIGAIEEDARRMAPFAAVTALDFGLHRIKDAVCKAGETLSDFTAKVKHGFASTAFSLDTIQKSEQPYDIESRAKTSKIEANNPFYVKRNESLEVFDKRLNKELTSGIFNHGSSEDMLYQIEKINGSVNYGSQEVTKTLTSETKRGFDDNVKAGVQSLKDKTVMAARVLTGVISLAGAGTAFAGTQGINALTGLNIDDKTLGNWLQGIGSASRVTDTGKEVVSTNQQAVQTQASSMQRLSEVQLQELNTESQRFGGKSMNPSAQLIRLETKLTKHLDSLPKTNLIN